MRRILWLILVLAAAGTVGAVAEVARPAAVRDLPEGFVEDTPITGLASPIAFDWMPNDPVNRRIYVGEKGGRVRVIKDGELLLAPSLTLAVSTEGERGLLGLAFDPDFAAHPYLYLYYTTAPGSRSYGGTPRNRVSRFPVSGDRADLQDEQILIDDIPSPNRNHNAGDLHFGPDGSLYISTGDGGDSLQAQNVHSLGGKILHVDRATGIGLPGNPFYDAIDASTTSERVWAYGLRNPFRFSVHPFNGSMYIADVGQGMFEEINQGMVGANYGWPMVEGPQPPGGPFTYPLFWYSRSGQPDTSFARCGSITGGPFVAGGPFADTYPHGYFFADYTCGRIWRLDTNAPDSATLFADDAGGPVHLAFGPDGALYWSDIFTGSLRRIRRLSLTDRVYLPTVTR